MIEEDVLDAGVGGAGLRCGFGDRVTEGSEVREDMCIEYCNSDIGARVHDEEAGGFGSDAGYGFEFGQ